MENKKLITIFRDALELSRLNEGRYLQGKQKEDEEFINFFESAMKNGATMKELKQIIEDVPANNAGSGHVAGLVGTPPVNLKRKKFKSFIIKRK